MAKDRKKLQHIHSSIPDRQPTPATLEVGEIAVNNAANQEFLSLKNSNDRVVRFSSDEQVVTWMEMKDVIPYSGIVDNVHLDTNRSNIEIKLNQVVARNTVKHDIVNGAKDIDGDYVNPTEDSGVTNGAGFVIDMSRYAMQGANPTFSGITNTCYSVLNGRTEILGGDETEGSCRSLLNIDVITATTNISSAWTTVGTADTYITSANTTIGNDVLHVSGTTTEVHDGDVIITNNNNYNISTKLEVNITSTGDTNIHSDANICETADVNATFYGATKTNVGINCNENASAATTNVYGNILNINASTANTTVNVSNTTATTTVYSGQTLNITEDTTDITSCEHLYLKTDDFKLEQCSNSGSAEFDFCNGFKIDSNDIVLEECEPGGSIVIKETNSEISGTTLIINEGDDITINTGDDFIINTSGDTTITTSGITQIISNDKVCVISNADANFGGDINTRIGADCNGNTGYSNNTYVTANSSAFTYAPTVVNSGVTNNNTFTTINNNAVTEIHNSSSFTVNSVDACINSTGIANFGGNVKTNIGSNCEGNPASNITNIYGDTVNISGDTINISGDTNIDGVLCVTSGLCKTLEWNYGDVKNASGDSTNFKDDKSFTIPQCVSDINRATLKYSYGDVRSLNGNSGGTYDPGENCNGVSVSDTITIPTSLDHLLEFSGSCYMLKHDICMEDNTIVANGFFSRSDSRSKENISTITNEELDKIDKVAFKSFNFKSDETKRKTYGVIAQEVQDAGFENLIHVNEDGMLNVDYTSLLLLKIAKMEKTIANLKNQVSNLSDRLNFGNN